MKHSTPAGRTRSLHQSRPTIRLVAILGSISLVPTAFGAACATDGGRGDADGGATIDGSDGSSGDCDTGESWEPLFAETFDDAEGPPFVPDHDGLPLALFPEDGTRWTIIQNTHVGLNAMSLGMFGGGRALVAFASGQPDPTASKAAIGRDRGFALGIGSIVRLKADVFVDAATGGEPFARNTLIDLEDTDDILLDGRSPGAGLRIAVDDAGRIVLDRGEVSGSDDGIEPPRVRLSNLRSDHVLPVDRRVGIEAILKLGVREPRSTMGPIDSTFDEAAASAWVEIYVTEEGGPRTLILKMRGTTLHDPEALEEVVERDAPGMTLEILGEIDYDVVQVGATNNRSTRDQQITVDNVFVDVRREAASVECDEGR